MKEISTSCDSAGAKANNIESSEFIVSKFVKQLLNKQTETSILAFRVKPIVKLYYDNLNRENKKIIKQAIAQLIEELSSVSEAEVRAEGRNVNINVNIALAKTETVTALTEQYSREYVDALKEGIRQLQETVRIYREKAERLEKTLNAVRQALSYGDVASAKKVLGMR